MDFNSYLPGGDNYVDPGQAPEQPLAPPKPGPLNDTEPSWLQGQHKAINDDENFLVTAAKFPFQAVGGLAQGLGSFLYSTWKGEVSARMSQPHAAEDIQQMIFGFSTDAPYHNDPELASNWVKDFNTFSEAAAQHPVFDPSKIGKGAEWVQGLVGAFSQWVDAKAHGAGDIAFDATNSPAIGAGIITAISAAGLEVARLLPYFGKKGYDTFRERVKKEADADIIGDVPNTTKGQAPKAPEFGALNFDENGNIVYEPTPIPGNVGPRPGITASTDQPSYVRLNEAGTPEIVQGQQGFIAKFARENGLDLATDEGKNAATAAWNEYANQVTLKAYPDAYIAYELKSSGFDALAKAEAQKGNPNVNGRQLYLNHVFDATEGKQAGGFQRTFTFAGEDFNFKDYLTYTPKEFEAVLGESGKFLTSKDMGPQPLEERGRFWQPKIGIGDRLQLGYLKYITEKSQELGLEPVVRMSDAVKRAFDLREQEVARLKITQEELAWKERFLESQDENLTNTNTPRFSFIQRQESIASNVARELQDARIEDIINRATTPVLEEPKPLGQRKKGQGGYIDPEAFSGIPKAAKQVAETASDIVGKEKDVGKVLLESGAAGIADKERKGKWRFIPDEDPNLLSNEERGSIFASKTFKEGRLSGGFWEAMGMTNATQWIRAAQDKSPTLRKLLDSMSLPQWGQGKPTIVSYSEAERLRLAEYHNKLEDIYKASGYSGRGKYGGLSSKENALLNKYFRKAIGESALTPRMRSLARGIRTHLDSYYKEIKEANIPGLSDNIGYLVDYFHRDYNMKGWTKAKLYDPWMKLMKKYEIDEKFAQEMWDGLHYGNRLSRVDTSDITAFLREDPIASRRSAIDYERVLSMIPDKELAPFLNDNVLSTLYKYGEEWTHRVSYAERFGANNEILRKDLAQIAKEFEGQGGLPKYVAQQLFNTVAAIDHSYKPWHNESAKAVQKGAITALNGMLLGGVTLSSLAELVIPSSYIGWSSLIKSTPHTVAITARRLARKVFHDIPKSQREQIFEATGAALNSIVNERLTSLYSLDFSAVDNALFKVYGLTDFTKFSKLSAVNAFITHATDLMKASTSEKTLQKWLKDGGFNAAKARDLTSFMDYYGLDLATGKDWISKGQPKDHPFYKQMVAGSLRFSEDVVLTPNPATLPLWFSNPRLAWLKHLRTFNSLFFTRTMNRWGNEAFAKNGYDFAVNAPKIAGGLVGIMAVSYLVNELRDQMKYGDQGPPYEKTVVTEMGRALDRAGLMPQPMSDIWNMFTRAKHGIGDVIAPLVSFGINVTEGSQQWLTGKGSHKLAKYLSEVAGPFSMNQESRTGIQTALEDFFNTVRHKKPTKGEWGFK